MVTDFELTQKLTLQEEDLDTENEDDGIDEGSDDDDDDEEEDEEEEISPESLYGDLEQSEESYE